LAKAFSGPISDVPLGRSKAMSNGTLKHALLDILTTRFNLEELKLLCFDLLDVDFDNLENGGREAKARSLVDYLERRERLPEILTYIRTRRKDIDLSQFSGLTVEITGQSIVSSPCFEFVNRETEFQWLVHRLSPQYVLIDGPAGYGKSRLLRRLQSWYQEEERKGWACALVDFHKEPLKHSKQLIINTMGGQINGYDRPPDAETIEDYVENFANALNSRHVTSGAVLLFDSVEELAPEMSEWLLYDFVARTYQELDRVGLIRKGYKFRAIFAGRYMAYNWLGRTHSKLPIGSLFLHPFTADVIMETIRRAEKRVEDVDLTEEVIRTISYHIMRITGGHPGCIDAILKELVKKRFIGLDRFFDKRGQARIHQNIVRPVIKEVWVDIPENLCQILETLSVFRRFNYDVLRELHEDGKIAWHSSSEHGNDPAWSLLQAITATHLIKRKERFYSDEIVRRLLAIKLCQDDAPRHRELCEYAETFYRAELAKPNVKNPHLLAIETTYQQLQRYAIDKKVSQDQMVQDLTAILNTYPDDAEDDFERRERLKDLLEVLTPDWEWQYLVDDLIAPGTAENIITQLKQKSVLEP
jgi:hypothetical protein